MKRFNTLITILIFGLASMSAQSVKIIDDIYVTPNEAKMIQAKKQAEKERTEALRREATTYKNGAKKIVFIDENGNPTTAIPDTVFMMDTLANENEFEEDSYYLNGFTGSQSDYEYAERIRRFHNPKYTITIADPDYDDIYFLDDNYWNVSIDGIYATITPTWNNYAWWDYRFSPYSYNSYSWRMGWMSPHFSYWNSGFYNPYYMGWNSWYGGLYSGWYDPWYGGYYGGYYGWSDPYYYYYGGYGYYPYFGTAKLYDTQNRRGVSRGVFDSPASGTRVASSRKSALNADGRTYTALSGRRSIARQGSTTNVNSRNSRVTMRGRSTTNVSRNRSSYPNVNTRSRTGAVRSRADWNNARSSYQNSRSSSVMTNRSGLSRSSNRSTVNSRSNRNSYSRPYNSGSNFGNSRSSSTTMRNSGSYTRSRSSSSRSSSSSYSRSSSSSRSSVGRTSSTSSRSSSSGSGRSGGRR